MGKTEIIKTFKDLVSGNPYPGRGIVVGKTRNGRFAVAAYFIMGRSKNSRNRVFKISNGDLSTQPFDPNLVDDPSLIIYTAVKRFKNKLIVTNGDQTDTVYEFLNNGLSFYDALKTRKFEPDYPNCTPRISALLSFEENDFSYEMNIIKSLDGDGEKCARCNFSYQSKSGLGHFLHTYITDGEPLPSFVGEPKPLLIPNDINDFCNDVWNSLDAQNKISLYVSYINLKSGETEIKIKNKNSGD